MGYFSWFTCDNEQRIRIGKQKSVYVLIPKEFGSGHIEEKCYDGYGMFGGKDIYDLIAEWNKDFLEALFKWPNWKCSKDEKLEQVGLKYMYEGKEAAQALADSIFNDCNVFRREWKRCLGIQLACYDEDNARLPYPVKIAGLKRSIYEQCEPSKKDPDQGL